MPTVSLWLKPRLAEKDFYKFLQGVSGSVAIATHSKFLRFLQDELLLSAASIALALRYREQNPGPLPMILWQYGLVTLEQLDQIYNWLESAEG